MNRTSILISIFLFTFLILSGTLPYSQGVSSQGISKDVGYWSEDYLEFVQQSQPQFKGIRWASQILQQLFNGVPIDVNVIFIGVDRSWVDENLILSNVHRWYAPIDRLYMAFTGEVVVYINYTINYNFIYLDDSVKNAYVNFLNSRMRMDNAPSYLQINGYRQAGYIRVEEAEEWLFNNVLAKYPELQNEYTLIIINTYPDIRNFYFYNVSYTDIDLGRPTKLVVESSLGVDGGGGLTRMLFMDLSAGPSLWNNVSVDVKPIFSYNLPSEKQAFSMNLAKIIDSAVILKFIPSWIYSPIPYQEFKFKAYFIVNGTPIDPRRYINPQILVREIYNLFGGAFTISYEEVGVFPISQFPELESAIKNNLRNGSAPLDVVSQYFKRNLNQFRSIDGNVYEVPMFMLFDVSVAYTGGVALEDENYMPAYIVSVLPTFALTGGLKLATQPLRGSLNPGDLASVPVEVYPQSAGGRLIIEGTVNGEIEIYVMDPYNVYLLRRGEPFTSIYNATFRYESFNISVSIPGFADAMFVLVYNPSWFSTASVDIKVWTAFPGWLGMTPLITHEAGHIMSLSHPHDGFNWTDFKKSNYDMRRGNFQLWLWSWTYGYMTYVHGGGTNDIFQIDAATRLYSLLWFSKAYEHYNRIVEPFQRYGFGIIPDDVRNAVETANATIVDAVAKIRSDKPDYVTPLKNLINMVNNFQNLNIDVQNYLLTLSYAVVDRDGNPLKNVEVVVTYPNGTVKSFTTDEQGMVTLTNAPWGEFKIEVRWSGVKVGEATFTETSSTTRTITADVFTFNIQFLDADGEPLLSQLDEIRISHDVLGQLTYSPDGIQAIPGRVTIEKVVYLGVDITPQNNQFDVTGPTTIEVRLDIYHLTVNFTDKNNRQVPGDLELEFLVGSKTIRVVGKEASFQVPKGDFTIQSVIYQGVNVLAQPQTVSVDGNTQITIQLEIFTLQFNVVDTLERNLSNVDSGVTLVIQHPNGTRMQLTSPYKIDFAVRGEWKAVEVIFMGKSYSLNVSVSLNENKDVKVTVPIGRLTLVVKDKGGAVDIQNVEVKLSTPGGTEITLSDSLTIEYAAIGTYRVVQVSWKGVDVTPSDASYNFEGGDATFEVKAEIYRVTIRFTDGDGREVPIDKVSFKVMVEGVEFQYTGDGTLMPKGLMSVVDLYYQGVPLNRQYQADASQGQVSFQLPIYTLKVRVEGVDDVLKGYRYRVTHPNGTVIEGEAGEGLFELPMLPTGSYKIEIYYLGVKVFEEDIQLTSSDQKVFDANVRLLTGTVKDMMGFPLADAEVKIYDQSTGELLATTYTDGSGRYRIIIPDITVEVETGFLTTARVTSPAEQPRRDISITFTPTSLGITIFLILALVGGAFFILKRGLPIPTRGRPVPRPPAVPRQPPTVAGNVCPNCGHVNKVGARFCVKCGTKLER